MGGGRRGDDNNKELAAHFTILLENLQSTLSRFGWGVWGGQGCLHALHKSGGWQGWGKEVWGSPSPGDEMGGTGLGLQAPSSHAHLS